ncbi:MAG: hypothetical protein ACE14W_09975 [Candidatus Velamenicoccus archaeovorus]
MKRIVVVAVSALVAIGPIGAAPASASGRDGGKPEVVRSGACSGSSAWKLKLSPDNGRIEVDLEVHEALAHQTWRVRMRHEGELFYRGAHRTDATGSFDVTRRANDGAGRDGFRVRAVNAATGEVCTATGTY